ncbi:MAG: dihydropteroate synthase, partial [Thermodesulfobacteriota bacterium]
MQNSNVWRLYQGRVLDSSPFLVMGILNITPNSFYDGGMYDSEYPATRQARTMFEQGADIVDMGGESTRPFSERVGLEEERSRVLPVLENLVQEFSHPLISVDTYKADMAREALEAGASIINDVSACSMDPGLKDVIADYKPGYILMHSKGRPENMQEDPSYEDVVGEIKGFFEQNLKDLTTAGLPEENIVLDPGIG